jgi:dolichyl-phosphate beta-glucosyltransferase
MAASAVELSVIIPAYNEAKRLPLTLRTLHQYLSKQPFTYEILVVLDGPSDETREVVRSLMARISNVKIFDRTENRGKGYTVREGMLQASGRIRLFTDADNSTDIGQFNEMKAWFEQGCDLVIASRDSRDSAGAGQIVAQVWYKRVIGHAGNLLVQLFAVPGIWDTQCGFKAFRGEVAERIFAQAKIDRWAFDIEVLALARAMNYKVGIIAARWTNDERGHVRWFDYLGVLRDTLKVRFNLSMRKYHF